jgi:hypothetical protein
VALAWLWKIVVMLPFREHLSQTSRRKCRRSEGQINSEEWRRSTVLRFNRLKPMVRENRWKADAAATTVALIHTFYK